MNPMLLFNAWSQSRQEIHTGEAATPTSQSAVSADFHAILQQIGKQHQAAAFKQVLSPTQDGAAVATWLFPPITICPVPTIPPVGNQLVNGSTVVDAKVDATPSTSSMDNAGDVATQQTPGATQIMVMLPGIATVITKDPLPHPDAATSGQQTAGTEPTPQSPAAAQPAAVMLAQMLSVSTPRANTARQGSKAPDASASDITPEKNVADSKTTDQPEVESWLAGGSDTLPALPLSTDTSSGFSQPVAATPLPSPSITPLIGLPVEPISPSTRLPDVTQGMPASSTPAEPTRDAKLDGWMGNAGQHAQPRSTMTPFAAVTGAPTATSTPMEQSVAITYLAAGNQSPQLTGQAASQEAPASRAVISDFAGLAGGAIASQAMPDSAGGDSNRGQQAGTDLPQPHTQRQEKPVRNVNDMATSTWAQHDLSVIQPPARSTKEGVSDTPAVASGYPAVQAAGIRDINSAPATNQNNTTAPPIEPRQVIDQIVRAAKIEISDKHHEMVIRLDPPELGVIHIRVSSVSGSPLSVHLETSTPWTRDLLDSRLQELRNSFQDSGINVGQCGVSLQSETGQSHSHFGETGRGRHLPTQFADVSSTPVEPAELAPVPMASQHHGALDVII